MLIGAWHTRWQEIPGKPGLVAAPSVPVAHGERKEEKAPADVRGPSVRE